MSPYCKKYAYPRTTRPSCKGEAVLGNPKVDLCLSGERLCDHNSFYRSNNSLMVN